MPLGQIEVRRKSAVVVQFSGFNLSLFRFPLLFAIVPFAVVLLHHANLAARNRFPK